MANTETATDTTDRPDRGAPGSPYMQVFTRFERRIWSFWEALKNSFLNCLRYIIIAALFLFLLAAVLLFNDIMAFHDRVASDVGDDARARRAVLMLHKIHENPDIYPPSEKQLPVGALAVTLGALQSTYTDLGRFRDFKVMENKDDQILVTSGRVFATANHRSDFKDLQSQLMDQIDGLDLYVTNNVHEAAVLKALKALKRRWDDIKNTANTDEQVVELTISLADFRKAIVESTKGILAHETSRRIKTTLEELDLEKIDAHKFTGEMDRVTTDIQQLKSEMESFPNTDTERDTLEGFLIQIKGMITPPVLKASIPDYSDGVHEMRSGIAEIGGNLPIDPVVPRIYDTLASIEKQLGDFKDSQGDLPQIDDALNQIDTALDDRFPADYLVARIIVDGINNLRHEMPALEKLVPATYQASDGLLTEGDTTKELFRKRLEAMKGHLDKIEANLQKQGRVIALANVLEQDENETAENAMAKAHGILQDFDALKRFSALMLPFSTWVSPRSSLAHFGLNPQRLATLTTDSITTIYVFLIGAIGSLLYITKYQLKLVIDGHRLHMRPPRPLPWFLFRPIFGIVVALALYFVVRAGQMAFGSGEDGEVGTTLNIPILSVLALFAGILSWQALAAIETRGGMWFRAQTRRPLWATGLGNGLRAQSKSITECAGHIGRSPEQVERWLAFRDKVPIELQDRILTWIDMRPDELFGDIKPSEDVAGKPMWAVGLRATLDSPGMRIDAESLVSLLREEMRPENIRRIKDWIALRKQVPPATQWRLVDLLEVPHHKLFSAEVPDLNVWGVELRRVIEDRKEKAKKIADLLGLPEHDVHGWKELDKPVPAAMQEKLMKHLERTFSQLFEGGDLDHRTDLFKAANDLSRALKEKSF